MKKSFIISSFLFLAGIQLYAQISINTDGSPPNPSAGLDVKFNNKGLLPPRMTNNQINAIVNPATGLMVFCSDCANGTGAMAVFSNGHWNSVVTGCPATEAPVAGSHIPYVNQITWNWNTVAGAIGYRWNTEAVYNTSTIVGATPTYIEAGLVCNTLYKRYAWAYGACGYSSIPVELSQTTTSDPPAPTASTPVPSVNQIVWNWMAVPGATGYKWDTTFNYATAADMGSATTKTETGLACNTLYTRYVWAYSACGNSPYLVMTATFTMPPPAPAAGTPVPSLNQIVWNWNTVSGATGYKWNTTNTYATAVDMGIATTQTETGLGCYTAYSRYIWAYNACGASLATILTSTTLWASVASPLAGTHVVSYNNILWKWNKVAGATGYKWGVVNNYNLATDVGSDTARLQINLICNSQYTTYVWAYNSCVGSAPTLMTATTLNLVPGAPIYAEGTPSVTEITWHWTPGLYASGSKWNTVNDYTNAIDVGYTFMHTETGLTCNTSYTRYVWDYDFCTFSPVTTITASTLMDNPPPKPLAGTQVAATMQIQWNWSAVQGANGYKWNTWNDYTSALDMGPVTTKTETGLTCSTPYERYVWAYSTCGYSMPLSVSQTTNACFPCGSFITVNHIAGTVAPVSKTVIYGTVTNIPGETTKCWITSNLGSDHQATAVTDTNEASAGWYWQFNRQQGYKHDGTTRTPNTIWISNINEISDWTIDNDPCAIELGENWRIPTYAEWLNVNNTGGWTGWNDVWNSGLRLHVAGYLLDLNGALHGRGKNGEYVGCYWSSTQDFWTYSTGYALAFQVLQCYVGNLSKSAGYTIRCVLE